MPLRPVRRPTRIGSADGDGPGVPSGGCATGGGGGWGGGVAAGEGIGVGDGSGSIGGGGAGGVEAGGGGAFPSRAAAGGWTRRTDRSGKTATARDSPRASNPNGSTSWPVAGAAPSGALKTRIESGSKKTIPL